MKNLIGGDLGLCTVKAIEGGKPFRHVFVTDRPTDHHAVALKEVTYVLPLWLRGEDLANEFRANLGANFVARLARLSGLDFDDGTSAPRQALLPGMGQTPAQGVLTLRRERGDLIRNFGVRDVFDWAYAVLHAPSYRQRFADMLRSDFPRIPLPRDQRLFAELVPLGTRLVSLHLLDTSPQAVDRDPHIRFVNNGGEASVGRFGKGVIRDEAGRVYLNDKCWFATVPQRAWEHWIGSYQPAQKWLKDRAETGANETFRPGRVLSDDDILHYRRMIVALDETTKAMAEIDQVIDRHGGWAGAFTGMTD